MEKKNACSACDIQDELPSKFQIRAEIKEAEAEGIHKEPVDMLDIVNEEQAITGHLDDDFYWPTFKDEPR